MKKIIATLIAIGLLLLAGCAPSAPPPTATPVPTPTSVTIPESAEGLIGIWRGTPPVPHVGQFYWQFKEDGTYRVATGAADRLENDPKVEGEFWFEGKQLFIKDIAGDPPWDVCIRPKQIIGKYEVQMLANGNLKLVKIEDECSGRANDLPARYERVP
jgi:hypothetical protein